MKFREMQKPKSWSKAFFYLVVRKPAFDAAMALANEARARSRLVNNSK